MGHFFPLAFDNFPKELKTCLESERRDMSSWALFRQGEFVLGCRSIWIAGQMGSWLLPEAIQMHLEAPVPLVWLWTFFSLMIIAIREQSHRQEIIEVVQRNISEHDLVVKYLGSMEKEVYMSLFHPLFCPEEVLEGWKESCQKAFFEEQSSITRTRQYQFGSIAGIPPDLACTLSVNLVGDLINDQISAISLSHATPWLAQASLADLYLPEDYKEFSDKETWEPQNAIDLISIRTTYYGPRKPIARTNLPGRNDPCSCGSGKKYKHCCQK